MSKITVHMDEDFYEKLQAAAKEKSLKLSNYGLTLLESGYASEQQQKNQFDPSSEDSIDVLDSAYNQLGDYPSKLDLICKASMETLSLTRQLLRATDYDSDDQNDILQDAKRRAKYAVHWFKDEK